MIEWLIIGLASLLVSLLTFFAGFGLGTLLMPVFAIFFPVDVAVALTAVVHFLNNIFKLVLTGRNANWGVVLRFGVPAIIAALPGAWLLLHISSFEPLFTYQMGDRLFAVTPVKLLIAVLLVFFALLEALPGLKKIQFSRDKMIIGGLLSGFFGGLSGHQGALRSAFLVRAGLSKESFIATGVIIACMIDFSRLTVYFNRYLSAGISENTTLLIIATLAAFAGAFAGNLLLKKVTLSFIQKVVTVMLILLSVALGASLV
jgi:uncharacterized membrane protein YfcA